MPTPSDGSPSSSATSVASHDERSVLPHQNDDAGFSAAVAALSSAFGDPTRRAIYLHLRSHPHSTVAELASTFSLHPNVVRHHLDRLIAGGHVEAEAPTRSAGAGRPAKRFSAIDDEHALDVGSRRDELLVALLERSLDLLGPEKAEQMATEVGEDYGRTMAKRMGAVEGGRTVRAAMATVAEALTSRGFTAHVDLESDLPSIVATSCPFGDAAAHHPVLCAVDRGMIAGLLAELGAIESTTEVTLSSRARGDDECRATA